MQTTAVVCPDVALEAKWAAGLVEIGKLQARNDVLGLNLQIATQQAALYRADAVEAAAALRQERIMFLALMAALLVMAEATE